MASQDNFFFLFLAVLCPLSFRFSETQTVPAIFIFGDSQVDVGNNDYLPFSFAKATLPPNGIDFPTKKPTGRFSNGKNAADFLAEKVGLPPSPPYLSLIKNKNRTGSLLMTGVSFASGGAGIFDGIDQILKIYGNGACKFVVIGLGVLGCIPEERVKNHTEECNEEANYLAVNYNVGLKSMLQDLKSELNGMPYSYFETYDIMHDIIQNPTTYGFTDVKEVCCGLGKLNAWIPCLPFSH